MGIGGIARSGMASLASLAITDSGEAVVALVPFEAEDSAEREVPAEKTESLRSDVESRDRTEDIGLLCGMGGR